jgi:TnsA endonuclease N terminal
VTSAVGSEFVVSGPFEAGVRVDGGEVRGCLADLSLGLLRRCEPVRVPRVYRRQRHMPGRWFSTTAGRFLEYESLLERDWMLLMDFDREVDWICEQPLRLRYIKDGRSASHVPDLLVWRQGVPELCDVKSEERVDDPTFRAQVEATGLACAEAGIRYRVLSEPDRRLLANVRWLAGFRERPPDPDGERGRMLAVAAAGSCTIAELLSGAREPMLARPASMNLLWTGDALIDLPGQHRRLPTAHRPHLSRDRRDSSRRRCPADLLSRCRRPPPTRRRRLRPPLPATPPPRRTSTNRRRLRERQPHQSAHRRAPRRSPVQLRVTYTTSLSGNTPCCRRPG